MTSTIATIAAIAGLCGLAATPAAAQSSAGQSSRAWQSPGEPLAAAQTTRAYVPNREVVVAVQQRLNELGYPAQVSGAYDASLRNNVLRFQSATGLRPTGEIDMSTIGALGINVRPVGVGPTTAMAPPPAAPVAQQSAVRPIGRDQVLERDQSMSSAQTRYQATQLENTAGLTVPNRDIQLGQVPPGLPPGFPVENLGID